VWAVPLGDTHPAGITLTIVVGGFLVAAVVGGLVSYRSSISFARLKSAPPTPPEVKSAPNVVILESQPDVLDADGARASVMSTTAL